MEHKSFEIGDICWVERSDGEIAWGVVVGYRDGDNLVKTKYGVEEHGHLYCSRAEAKSSILQRALSHALWAIETYNKLAKKYKQSTLDSELHPNDESNPNK